MSPTRLSQLSRREFLATAAAGMAAPAMAGGASVSTCESVTPSPLPIILPRALKRGDTLGIVSPAGATYVAEPVERAVETLTAMGFKVKPSPSLKARYGHFAGNDQTRADAVNAMFADPAVNGILAFTGGSGCTRIVDLLDYPLIQRNPKFFGGFSDLTALLNAIHRQTGLITFHSPTASSEWNPYSLDCFRRMTMLGETLTLVNPIADEALPVQRKFRTRTLVPGKARGRLVGGNLTVLATLAGSRHWPNFDGAILFVEDINEYLYRLDRVFAHLRAAGAFKRLAGVVLGQFTDCNPGDDNYGTLTLDEIFTDYFGHLGIPVFSGAMIGHVAQKMTIPIGLSVEMDADRGQIRLLESAVRT